LYVRTVKHVSWIKRMPWTVANGEDDKGSTMIRMGVSGWMFPLVPAYPGCPGSKAVKRSLLLLFHQFFNERSNIVNHQRYQSMSLPDLWPDKYKTILIWKCRHIKFLHWHIWPAVLQFLSQFTTVLSGNLTGHWLHRGITGNKTRSHRYRDRCKMAAGK